MKLISVINCFKKLYTDSNFIILDYDRNRSGITFLMFITKLDDLVKNDRFLKHPKNRSGYQLQK